MDTDKELLTYLIDNRIFESSASALASCLGYKGRMAFSRLKEGNIRTSTVDNIINDICTHFDLNYSDLVDITDMFRIGRSVPQCIWGLMMNNIHLLRYFADPDYINSILELGAAFAEWEDLSYWHETNVAYSKREKLWTLFFRESNSPLHGMYLGQTFEAGKDNETFIPKENFSLIFWEKENDDDEFATIQACNIINSTTENYTIYYGLYKYDDISNEIIIKWNDENENSLNIPSRLKRITREKPAERDEQVWWNIIRRFDENDSLKLFTETLLDRLNTEYLDDDYDIQDVTISRKFFTLTIATTDGTKEYSIPIDAYSFLRNLRVFDEVTIKKDTRTEELFVSWPWAGYEIPLSEFKINMQSFIFQTQKQNGNRL